jgi:8-oxo-dGTP pyrophosphatase MutT (NUDIX family)
MSTAAPGPVTLERMWRPSVTVAAVLERDGRFLMIEEDSYGSRVLNQPAGHWEPGETLIEACARETMEESAYEFAPTSLIAIYRWRFQRGTEDNTFLRFTFAGEIGAHHAGRALDREILGTVWMTPDELRAERSRHRSPLVMRSVDDYLAGKRHDLALIQHLVDAGE